MQRLQHVIQIRSPVPQRPLTSVKNHLNGGFLCFETFLFSNFLVVNAESQFQFL